MKVQLFGEICGALRRRLWADRTPLTDWETRPDGQPGSWKPYAPCTPWPGPDRAAWFRASVKVAPALAGKPLSVVFDLADALLHVNGKVWQGIDLQHPESLITRGSPAGSVLKLEVQAYSGRRGPGWFGPAFLQEAAPEATGLYNALSVLDELEASLDASGPQAAYIRKAVAGALSLFEGLPPESPEFGAAAPRALGRLLGELGRAPAGLLKPGLIHLLGQSHLDVVWLWTLAETRRKCARTFSTALRLMERYPEFRYAQSQAWLYEETRRNYPGLYREIRRRVKEGRWLATGSMWVEPDCNIPNGESLVRQVLYGRKYFLGEFGAEQDTVWLPDTFGYCPALPQIMRRSGLKYFFTTKLSWNDTNPFPYHTFRWRGLDGSEVLAQNPPEGLEGRVSALCLGNTAAALSGRNAVANVAQTFGYGDGGGGPTPRCLDAARVFRRVPGMPRMKVSSPAEFFRALEKERGRLPLWDSDLYLELHRGTFTTHGWIKRANREAETALYNAELLSSLAWLEGAAYPAARLESAWKKLLLNQFHDILPGTSIEDGYLDARRDFAELERETAAVCGAALGRLTRPDKLSFTVFNGLGWARDGAVELEVPLSAPGFSVTREDGSPVLTQVLERGRGRTRLLCLLRGVPPLSFAELSVSPSPEMETPPGWKVSAYSAESPLMRLRFDRRGRLVSVFDKRLGRELVEKGGFANELRAFRELPKKWEAWDIDPDYAAKEFRLFRLAGARPLEAGPVRSAVRLEFVSPNGSRLVQDVRLWAGSARVDFRTAADWKEDRVMLKASFDLAVKALRADYGVQFGAMSHPCEPSDPRDRAKYEISHHQWAGLSAGGSGAALLNDCKYGFDVKGSSLRLTLLRSPRYPHHTWPSWMCDPKPTDQGRHEFAYSLYSHSGDWRRGGCDRRGAEMVNPLVVRPGRLRRRLPPPVRFGADNVAVDSVKLSEDGRALLVRAHETHGRGASCRVFFGRKPRRVTEADLMERPLRRLGAGTSGRLRFGPFEIKTLLLEF